VTPQATAERIRDTLRALGCPAKHGPGDCATGSWWVSAGDGTLEEPAFTVDAAGVAFCALRFAPVGSLRARKAAPFDEAVVYQRCAEVATLMLRRADRNAANARAWAVADELKKLGMTAAAQEGRVVLTLSFSPEYARDMGPKLLAMLGARKADS
jgi:hypothetical protein